MTRIGNMPYVQQSAQPPQIYAQYFGSGYAPQIQNDSYEFSQKKSKGSFLGTVLNLAAIAGAIVLTKKIGAKTFLKPVEGSKINWLRKAVMKAGTAIMHPVRTAKILLNKAGIISLASKNTNQMFQPNLPGFEEALK